MRQAGLFGLSDQLKRLSDCGDPLETMARVVDFEIFRPALETALAYGDGAKGQMGLFISTIGIVRAEAKITLANLAYNIDRLISHEWRAATG